MFEGEKVTVLLRLPPSFVHDYTRFIHETGIYKNKTDFFNHALEAYLDGQRHVQDITECIHTRNGGRLRKIAKEFEEAGEPVTLECAAPQVNRNDWLAYKTKDTEKEDWLDE